MCLRLDSHVVLGDLFSSRRKERKKGESEGLNVFLAYDDRRKRRFHASLGARNDASSVSRRRYSSRFSLSLSLLVI